MHPADRISMLPPTLLLLLNAALSVAQTRQTLPIGYVVSEKLAPNPPFFTIPTASQLAISVAMCSGTTDAALPRFFVTNSSSDASPGSSGGDNVFEIVLNQGHGNWTGTFPSGGVLGVEDAGQIPFEIGVSSGIPIHEWVPSPPLVGDTTATQALLFSPPFAPQTPQDPAYPNYALPDANLTIPSPPSNPTNYTLVLLPTSASLATMPQTACMLLAQKSSGTIVNQTLWPRDASGWRMEYRVTGLTAKTNYTMYVVENTYKVGGPIFFTTKSSTFSCPLVSRLPYCPSIGYAVPLPPPPAAQAMYDSTNLPESITTPLLSSLTNFTTTLSTFACGRDFYSPLVSCADCQRAYRTWLCTISFPRCGDADTAPAAAALLTSQSPNARNAAFPPGNSYTQLLPCIETCTAADRACPNFLKFRCPLPRFNAAQSYGVGFIDSGEDGVVGQGSTGTWADNYGNVWCTSGQ
ncbi:stretch-activated cation channel Mid1 [Mycena belliarum]|uniref:Stretch-activated cation channel Mid1 n=1 Tax=Mycena belliarum TaxID=1033014 RepID=A0AAD6U418_9AGAR|nr:stretch-activated cation channel Mid1 [Mycena belliae]